MRTQKIYILQKRGKSSSAGTWLYLFWDEHERFADMQTKKNLVNITEDKQGRACKKMLQSKIFPNKVEITLHFILNSYVVNLPLALKIFKVVKNYGTF